MELLCAAALWSKRWCSAQERLRTLQDPSCLSPQTEKRVNQSACTGGVVVLETVHTEDVQCLLLFFYGVITSAPGINIRLVCLTPQVDSKVSTSSEGGSEEEPALPCKKNITRR